jgi:5-oxoprolinase (ATP-hydrolysing) subunit A
MYIDLNSDVGESFGPWQMGADAGVLRSISSANIACGFHAGDPGVMRQTIRLARDAGVAVGAHPGFPDLVGFGRRELKASPRDVEDMVLYQVGALAAIAASEGVRLAHVKAHGALYNMAARDRALADAIARATAAFDRSLVLFGLPGSALLDAGRAAGLRVASEGFADRSYEADGSLTSRTLPGSVIHDAADVVRRSVRMVRDGRVTARDGSELTIHVHTLCTHGDTPGADELTRLLRQGLEREGVIVAAVGAHTTRA